MMLQNVRLSFPNLWRASSFKPDQDKKFSATFLFDEGGEVEKQIKKGMLEAAEAKWPGKGKEKLQSLASQGKLALRKGIEKPDYDGFGEGTAFVNASNAKRPQVFDRDKTPLTEDDGRPYAGCYVNALVEFWGQDNEFGKRINCSLRGVQFVKDGEPFGGGAAPATADDFPALEDETDTADMEDFDDFDV